MRRHLLVGAAFARCIGATRLWHLSISDTPLFLVGNVQPLVMLDISKDQQLYKKAYNDYSDLDNDGQLETTYKHSIDYYGYFDPKKCYVYGSTDQRFEPDHVSAAKYCTGQWSGNFLNWASMARMDAVRKLLYGGMRSKTRTDGDGNGIADGDTATLQYWRGSFCRMMPTPGPSITTVTISLRLTPYTPPTTDSSSTTHNDHQRRDEYRLLYLHGRVGRRLLTRTTMSWSSAISSKCT